MAKICIDMQESEQKIKKNQQKFAEIRVKTTKIKKIA